MSYQVLARKWRPKSFEDVVGQEHVLTVLSNALSLGRVHHAYLFSGTRGVGKTSIARLLAKGLNCRAGITASPCGECDNCRDIQQGRFIDLLEIDAASRTKVEDTREILDNIQYLPTKGRFKVYLIDEVHMLSRSSFNALLKTLEEPPEHVKFLLATTDPQKLPITILSRCLHLHLSVLDDELIKKQLTKILQTEQISQDEKALQLLAKAANGSMRDALSLTDQAIALGNGKIELQLVSTMLGTLDKAIPFTLVESLYRGDGSTLMEQIESAAKQGIDWDNLLIETTALLHQISFLQIVPTAIGDYGDFADRIRYLAQYIDPNDIQLFYQILLVGRKELIYAPDKKAGVEMSFLRALAFIPKILESKTVDLSSSDTNLTKNIVTRAHNKTFTQTPLQATLSDDIVPTVTPEPLLSKENTDKKDIDTNNDDMSDMTKNILAARQQIINNVADSEKTVASEKIIKKFDRVENHQPENSQSKHSQLKNNQFEHLPTPPGKNAVSKAVDISDNMMTATKTESMTEGTYQWQFSEHSTPNLDKELGSQSIQSAFEHEKTPELIQKLIQAAIKIDPWSAQIEGLSLPPLVKQIAINTFLEQIDDNHIVLHLRRACSHLVKNKNNINCLSDILSTDQGKTTHVDVVIDDNPAFLTPLEIREKIYQTKLSKAKQTIAHDSKVAMICQFFEAEIDDKSIRPI